MECMTCKKCYNPNTYNQFDNMQLASAYVPWQEFRQVMDAGKGMNHGTIFAELVLPFYGAKAACGRKGGMYGQSQI